MTNTQQLINQAQVYQQQIQNVMAQKEAISMQIAEIKAALESMEKTTETDVYKISGAILIKAKKSDVKKDLTEKKETMEVKSKTLEASEKKLKAKIEELRSKLSKTVTVDS
jgi:prefoldin beta subunit